MKCDKGSSMMMIDVNYSFSIKLDILFTQTTFYNWTYQFTQNTLISTEHDCFLILHQVVYF